MTHEAIKLRKIITIALADSITLVLSFFLSLIFHNDISLFPFISLTVLFYVCGLLLLSYMAASFFFNIHKIVWRFSSLSELIRLSFAVISGYVTSTFLVYWLYSTSQVPRSILPLQAIFYLCGLVLTRLIYRLYCINRVNPYSVSRVLIIGAGRASEHLIREMQSYSSHQQYQPIGLLDDDKQLHGRIIHGVKVLGDCSMLEKTLLSIQPDLVILAIPSLSDNSLLNTVYASSHRQKITLRVLPGLQHLTDGRVTIDALRQVAIEDLLGREPVSLVVEGLTAALSAKTVMVTGGGGSIGSELCRQLAVNELSSLVIVDHSEFNLYQIHRELKRSFPQLRLEALLVDVSNYNELYATLKATKPHIVFHAAAYKHVPLLENQIFSAVKNNIIGTQNVADLASQFQVEHMVLVSTDKAVNPSNIMGMSKRIAEIYCQDKNSQSQTRYTTVRFGNVLGSAGSVLPLFREQLQKGGPLTVTHADMTRYFMMIPEAVNLILKSFLLGQGGQIFVLDMGEPVKIIELAEQLIRLSGKVPYQEIGIAVTGLRSGEKLYEELFYDTEVLTSTSEEKIHQSEAIYSHVDQIDVIFSRIKQCLNSHSELELMTLLLTLVPEYQEFFCKPPVNSSLLV